MLEWLQDAERYYRQQFLRRKNMLQTLRPDDFSLLETAPKRWESLKTISEEERISDTLFLKRELQDVCKNLPGGCGCLLSLVYNKDSVMGSRVKEQTGFRLTLDVSALIGAEYLTVLDMNKGED